MTHPHGIVGMQCANMHFPRSEPIPSVFDCVQISRHLEDEMNLSQLIKTLVDYLDLGKRIATTIPGMVLARISHGRIEKGCLFLA